MITGNIFGDSVMTYSYAKLGQSDQDDLILFCFNSTGKINTIWLTDRILVLFIFFTQLYLSHMFKRGRKPENQEKSF
jgi:hypothetical protein